ncbi:tetratricopeptide repeat protein [Blastomonas sp.]|uniref:2OG-Fe(II) oxygenase family protein n=1 Tax=Blastomonas sp. TaxID=1909299 RepID=UPI00261C71D9|nr:tetratricopeptide repeat protein [Blastomonas sp.]MDM7955692.1 tetratricopeptide repeat protein [Blastomonas sp.]
MERTRSQADLGNWLNQAMAMARSGRLDDAEALLGRLLAIAPNQPDALQLMGMVARQRGNHRLAADYFHQSLAQQPNQPHVLNNLGNSLKDLGDHGAAANAYQQALALMPDYAEARINLALAQIALNQPSEAKATLAPLTATDGGSARAWAVQGQACAAMSDNRGAIDAYRSALTLRPGHAPWMHNLAVALRLAGRASDALPLLRDCEARSPGEAVIPYNLGHCLQDLGRFDEAAAAYRRAIALTPGDASIHDSLSRMLWQQGDSQGHLDSYRQALTDSPNDAALLCGLANRLTLCGHADQAAALLDGPATGGTGGADLRCEQGRALWSAGRPDDALAAFAAALALDADHAPALRESARCLVICGALDSAAPRIARLLANDPTDQQALALQALVWRLTGDVRARWLMDPALIGTQLLVPDNGQTDTFNQDLDAALNALHTGRHHPLEQTLRGGTQTTDDLFARTLPEIEPVREMIERAVRRYILALPDDATHPFSSRKTTAFAFSGSWSVRLSDGGHHTNHIHPEGWISAVYYVAVPDAVADGHSGWLKFGETGMHLGEREQILQQVRPQPGLLVLFPSYFYHGTVPFADTAHRTTIAFDIVPAD